MLNRFTELCRSKGLSITIQRQTVYSVLYEMKNHPAVDQIFEAVRQRIPTISQATVYRTLETLAEEGLIRRVLHPGSVARYDARIEPHYHLICVRCGKTEDFPLGFLDTEKLPECSKSGYVILEHDVIFHGICPECQKREKHEEKTEEKTEERTEENAK